MIFNEAVNRPIEAIVVLLPMFEFLHLNQTFPLVLLEFTSTVSDQTSSSNRLSPPPFTFLTLSSYLLTHASSAASPRAIAYANLSLNILLTFVENEDVMSVFCQSTQDSIRLCRQVSLTSLWFFCFVLLKISIIATGRECLCYLCHPRHGLRFALYWIVVYFGCVTISINVWKCIRTCGSCTAIALQPLTLTL